MNKREPYTVLVDYLKYTPRSENQARLRQARAEGIADKCGILIHTRKEGEAFKDGLNIYPSQDKGSVGAVYCRDKKIFGWRWSLVRRRGHRWSQGGLE